MKRNKQAFTFNCHAELVSASSRCIGKNEEALNKDSFMASLRSGFTLIELLVVVLIIGILAAVALPQYQKTVAKSRMAEIMEQIRVIENNMDLYVLEHDIPEGTVNYADMAVAVDVPFSTNSTFECTADHCYGNIPSDDTSVSNANFGLYFGKGSNFPIGPASEIFGTTSTWKHACLYGNSLGEYLCKSLEPYGYLVYAGI